MGDGSIVTRARAVGSSGWHGHKDRPPLLRRSCMRDMATCGARVGPNPLRCSNAAFPALRSTAEPRTLASYLLAVLAQTRVTISTAHPFRTGTRSHHATCPGIALGPSRSSAGWHRRDRAWTINTGSDSLRCLWGMELIWALSNPEVQERLPRLKAKLDQIEAGGRSPKPTTLARSLRVGDVSEAIMRVLTESIEPMRMRDIHTEVERVLGQPVGRSAIKNWLANHVRGDDARLVRLGRGRYRFAE
jgi:hypothetical protein